MPLIQARGSRLLVTLCVLLVQISSPSFSQTPAEVHRWLDLNGYEVIGPAETQPSPGMLVLFKGGRLDSVDEIDVKVSVRKPDVAVPKRLRARRSVLARFFLGEAGVPERLRGVGRAVLEFNDARIASANVGSLQDRIRSDKGLLKKIENAKSTVYVVHEVLRADGYEVKFFDESGELIVNRSKLRGLRVALGDIDGLDYTETGLRAKNPRVIGARMLRVRKDGRVLGSDDAEASLVEASRLALEQQRRMSVDPPATLHSDFQICALIVAQGNYPDRKGESTALPGAVASAQLVESSLHRLLDPRDRSRVRVVQSRTLKNDEHSEVEFNEFDRWSREGLAGEVTEFVEEMREVLDPDKECLVLFYYFGHGAADGLNHWVYAVPEAFDGRIVQPVHELDQKLLPLDWVQGQLSQLSDRTLMLVDACREHDFGDVELARVLSGPLLQQESLAVDLGASLEVIQFMGGLYGPNAMVFGGSDGLAARTVTFRAFRGVGPLAAILHTNIEKSARSRDLNLSLDDWVSDLEAGVKIDGEVVSSFTLWREDFREENARSVALSTTLIAPEHRSSRYTPEPAGNLDRETDELGELLEGDDGLEDAGSTEEPWRASGVRVGAFIPQLPNVSLLDFAYSGDAQVGWIVDAGGRLFLDDRQKQSINQMAELRFPALGCSLSGELFLDQGRLEGLSDSVVLERVKLLRKGLRAASIGPSSEGDLVLVAEENPNSGEPTQFWRVGEGGEATLIGEHVIDVVDAVERRAGEIFVADAVYLHRWVVGQGVEIIKGVESPSCLARSEHYVFALDALGTTLYRIGAQNQVESLKLFSGSMDGPRGRHFLTQGFQALSDERILILGGEGIWDLELANAQWTPRR